MEAAGIQWGFDGKDRFAHDGMLKAALHIRGELDKSGVLQRVFLAGSKARGDMKTPLTEVRFYDCHCTSVRFMQS
jgi:hypothetical protein